jgi:hypothetical protein
MMKMAYINVEHRKLAVVLKDVECVIEIGEDKFEKTIEFPTGWVLKKKEAINAPTYWSFTTLFMVRWFKSSPNFCFGYRPSHDFHLPCLSLNIVHDLLITVAEGEVEIEIEKVMGVLVSDHSDIGVKCVLNIPTRSLFLLHRQKPMMIVSR